MTVILALDLATQTGWAAGQPCGPVAYGNFRCDAKDHCDRFLQMTRRVSALTDEHGAAEVVLEAAFISRQTMHDSALGLLYGYRAAAMIAARNRGLPVFSYEPGMIRRNFMGAGGMKRAAAKAAVLEKCRWLGLAPRNDDEADAIAAWSFRCSIISTQHLAATMRKGGLAR